MPALISNPTYSVQQLGPCPTRVVCPKCTSQVLTRVDFEITASSFLISLLLCIVCLPFGLLFISFKKTLVHRCPNCRKNLGGALDLNPEFRQPKIDGVNEVVETTVRVISQQPKNNCLGTMKPMGVQTIITS